MRKKVTSFLTVLVVAIVGVWQWLDTSDQTATTNQEQIVEKQHSVEEVDLTDPPRFEKIAVSSLRSVDGDTFAFYTDKEYKLRLLMVDTPESVKKGMSVQPFGKEASEFTKEQLAKGDVSLVFDKGDVADNYGRLLAYVYVGENSLQEELLKEGLGIVRYVNKGGDSFVDQLLTAQEVAQKEKLGVWSQENYVTQMKNGYYRYNEVQ
ncbi:thermonuclease family protein [Candidatus Enterococcus willemsii]|uniref:TNase-like domain-containing protein n=1 Tax=Candidatus Enterococcus willemsii TaxID=1857215 RepID=A0ABQ6Z3I2_9ENTE|nr:thermonuclease family protein [Enterococcus sp. CU12B]KAF1306000.1 hypothetical protein BAU17_03275 [Enterococcus sp. CU12B]